MEPLVTNRRVLTWLCLYPSDPTTSTVKKLAHLLLAVVVVTTMTGCVVTSAIFFVQFAMTRIEEAMLAMFQLTGSFSIFYMFFAVYPSRHKVEVVFTQLAEIYEDHVESESFFFLKKANNTSEWIWKYYFKFIKFAMASVPISIVVGMILCYMWFGYLDMNYYYRPFRITLPWNQATTNMVGYIFEMIFVMMIALSYLLVNGSFLLLFVSICFHHRAFHEMFEHSTKQLGKFGESRNDLERLCRLVQFHTTIKDWFQVTANLYSNYIFVHLICDMLFMSGVLFEFDMQFRHMDFNILTAIQSASCTAPNIFLYCSFGKMASESFENMSQSLYECDWQHLPIELQHHVKLMILNTQSPVFYDGFGVVVLDLETCTNLCCTVYSYYMMFKTATE